MQLEFSRQILEEKKTIQISDLIKIRPVGAELFHADITKLIVVFRKFCERA
jgi:hypothetical protein